MNPTEQKAHKRVTDDLRRDLDQTKEDLGILLSGVANKAQDDLSKLRVDLNAVAKALNSVQDSEILHLRAVEDKVLAFQGAGFWARVRWILTGRIR